MTSKLTITRERLEALAVEDDLYNYPPTQEELNALARMALAAMDNEPVAWMHNNNDIGIPAITVCQKIGHYWMAEFENVQPLYRHAQSAPDRDQVRREHAEWSQTTFGNVGPVGPLKHLSKEALEAAAEPGDLSEWADMQFLLWDAQRRAGITDEQITQAMIEKLDVNKLREWPAPKDGEPRLHIKEQPAPTCEPITVTDDMAYAFHHALTDSMLGADDVEEIKTGLRAVFANLTAPIVSAKYPERLPCSVLLEPGLRFGKGIKTSTVLAALARRAVYESDMAALSPEEKAEFRAKIADFKALMEQPAPVVPDERAAFNAWNNEDNLPIAGVGAKNAAWLAWQARAKLAGNSPVIPDGYLMVPKEPTERMVIDGFESEPDETFSDPEVWEAYEAMSGCGQAHYRARLCWAAMIAAAMQEVKGE